MDAGPGRLAKEASCVDFRERMHNLGLVILLGLPNATSATQEMDQGYEEFKRETDKATNRVVAKKMKERAKARKKAELAAEARRKQQGESQGSYFKNDTVGADSVSSELDKNACSVKLGNPDLPYL